MDRWMDWWMIKCSAQVISALGLYSGFMTHSLAVVKKSEKKIVEGIFFFFLIYANAHNCHIINIVHQRQHISDTNVHTLALKLS